MSREDVPRGKPIVPVDQLRLASVTDQRDDCALVRTQRPLPRPGASASKFDLGDVCEAFS